jgi:hypothetical protein
MSVPARLLAVLFKTIQMNSTFAPQLQLELARAACRLKELEETVKTQRRALSSMQQQLSAVSAYELCVAGCVRLVS